jgi:hypothetical protein
MLLSMFGIFLMSDRYLIARGRGCQKTISFKMHSAPQIQFKRDYASTKYKPEAPVGPIA